MNSVISCDSSQGRGQTWTIESPSSCGTAWRISPAAGAAEGLEGDLRAGGQAFFELPFPLALPLAAGFFLALTTLPLAAPLFAGFAVMKSSVI